MLKRWGLTALLLAAAILSGCTEQEAAIVPELMEPVGVQSDMAVAYIGDIYDIEYYDASVKPYVQELYFEVSGTVSEMNVYPGMPVREGEAIIELDQTSLEDQAERMNEELAYAQRDNAYTDAQAELDIEMLELELRHLMEEGAGEQAIALKENEIEQKRAALRQTQDMRQPDIEKKKAELEKIEEQLNKNVMRAPFDGRIIYGDMLSNGSWVTAYDPIGFIADDSRVEIVCEYISESVINSADRLYAHIGGQQYEIEPVPFDQEEYISAMLSGVTLTSNFSIINPEESPELIEAGQYAAVCVIRQYIEGALLVPSGAVLRDASGRYVYVDEDGTRVRRAVKIGKTTDGLTQITEGLEEGEIVYVKD